MQKVFLVDDSPLVRERLAAMVGTLPGTRLVGEAAGAEEAIGAILAARPDVVLLDLTLAQGSGFDVLAALHRQAPDIAVYMLSNFAAAPYRRQAERLGASGFFDKSTDMEQVRAKLTEGNTPCPPPNCSLSNDCSRSRLAVSENIELLRSISLRFTASFCVASARGVIAPLWQASVSRIL